MIVGPKLPAATPATFAADSLALNAGELDADAAVIRVVAYIDGLGGVQSIGRLRPVVFGPDATLLTTGPEVIVDADRESGWLELALDHPGHLLAAGECHYGVHVGPSHEVLRLYRDDDAGEGFVLAGDAYADGTASPHGVPAPGLGPWSMFLELVPPFVAPNVDDLHLSRLPFELTQRIFGASGPDLSSRRTARAGWHGPDTHPEEGAVAIARSGGPLEALVGERLRVIHRPTGGVERTVYVYLYDEQEWPEEIVDEDFSLPARAWLDLAPWPLESINVTVEVLV